MLDKGSVHSIRERLSHAWAPFFARFGRLTPIQIAAIPRILDGKNVVITAPTASGKTEAVVAPLAERCISLRPDDISILYIVPTRALANDTIERIAGPLSDMGLKAQLRHGDKPYLNEKSLPDLLVTTPESLDSLLCRRTEAFRDVQAIVLDEIHLLDNTYRGDQLRILLNRLRQVRQGLDFAVHLMSATLADPESLAARYTSSFEIVKAEGHRAIDYFLLESVEAAYKLAREKRWDKLLCFCNRRESVENLARELALIWKPYPVVAHHGSLSREERESAEATMREARRAVCCATSTLEIGIDIGNIDAVVLAEVPWSISALLQRVGRGNRRSGRINVVGICQSKEEQEQLTVMLEKAKAGHLSFEAYFPDVSVAVQQTFSYLYQTRSGVPIELLIELLAPLCSNTEVIAILSHLNSTGWIEFERKHWFPSTQLVDLGEKGRIHSNIPDSTRYTVTDIDTGRPIGHITGLFDDVFVLARRTWRVISRSGQQIRVKHVPNLKGQSPAFQRTRNVGAFFRYLPPEFQKNARQQFQ